MKERIIESIKKIEKISNEVLQTKEKIIRMQNEERQKNELKKQKRYNADIFANRQKEDMEQQNNEATQIMRYKENIFKKILNRIKKFWTKK